MSYDKKIATILFQLDTLSAGNRTIQEKVAKVRGEWEMERNSTVVISEPMRAQLNRVIHATRAFDTGLRLFLDKYNHRSNNSHAISDYIKDLQRNVTNTTGFKQLDGTYTKKIQEEVTDKRNSYVHAAGAFPTKEEANFVISRILEYYTIVLGLAK